MHKKTKQFSLTCYIFMFNKVQSPIFKTQIQLKETHMYIYTVIK